MELPICSARDPSRASTLPRFVKSEFSAQATPCMCALVGRTATSAMTGARLREPGVELELQDKAFLIKGGSSGLGKALAIQLVREGAKVALMARDPRRLAETAAGMQRSGGDAVDFAGDVRCLQDLERFVEVALARFGGIDGVVNNAGELSAGPFADNDDAVWEQDLALKLMGAVGSRVWRYPRCGRVTVRCSTPSPPRARLRGPLRRPPRSRGRPAWRSRRRSPGS
jgi:hypothetical protein